MLKKYFLPCVLALSLLAACNTKSEGPTLEEVRALKTEWEKNPADQQRTVKLDSAIKEYSYAHAKDTATPRLLMLSAMLNHKYLQNRDQALAQYEAIFKGYPEHDLSRQALLFSGFIYREEVKDTVRANVMYRTLIEKYPQSAEAEQARVLLSQGSKSEGEMLDEIIRKNKEQNKDSVRKEVPVQPL